MNIVHLYKKLTVYLCCAVLCCDVYVHCQFNTVRPHTERVYGCFYDQLVFFRYFSYFFLHLLCDQFHMIHICCCLALVMPIKLYDYRFFICFFLTNFQLDALHGRLMHSKLCMYLHKRNSFSFEKEWDKYRL